MITKNILNITSKDEFREWLSTHPEVNECYLILKRGKPIDPSIFYYIDAVEVALCFGWIDSTLKRIDGNLYQRFTPRNKNSVWSELNKERVRRLIKLDLMTEAGLKVLSSDFFDEFKIDEDVKEALIKEGVYETFLSFPSLYQRVRSYNVAFYKRKDKNAYNKALMHLIIETRKGKMFGEWNDWGRLLDY